MKTKFLLIIIVIALLGSFQMAFADGKTSLHADPYELSSAVPLFTGEPAKPKQDIDFSKEMLLSRLPDSGQGDSQTLQPFYSYLFERGEAIGYPIRELLVQRSNIDQACKNKENQSVQNSLLEELLFGSCPLYKFGDLYTLPPNELKTIKQQLQRKIPILASLLNYENLNDSRSSETLKKESGQLLGLAPLVLVGYDDDRSAFRALRLGGKTSEDRLIWISYSLFQKLARTAYFLQPRPFPGIANEKEAIQFLEDLSESGNLLETPNRVIASEGDGQDRIRVQWNSIPNALGYEIFRARKGESKFQSVGLARAAYFEDFGIQKEIAYVYQVQAISEHQKSKLSPISNEGYATTKDKETKRKIFVTGLRATTGNFLDRIELNWDLPANLNMEVTIYKWNTLFRSFKSIGKSNKSTFSDLKASKGEIEIYRVGIEGNQDSFSSLVIGYTRKSQETNFQLEKPLVSKGLFKDNVTLQWKPIPGAVSYIVFKKANSSSVWKRLTKTDETQWEDREEPISTGEYSISAELVGNRFSIPTLPEKGFATVLATRSMNSPLPENLTLTEDYNKQTLKIQWKSEKADTFQFYFRVLGSTSWKKWKEIPANQRSVEWDFPVSNELVYITLSSKSEGLMESPFANPQMVALYKPVIDTKKTRTFGESPIAKFSGPWTAMYWDGKSSVKPISLEILSDEFSNAVELKWNQKSIYKGKVILEGTVLEDSGKWKISVSPDADSIQADVFDKGILPEKARISFIRE